MDLSKFNLEVLRTIPLSHKIGFLALVVCLIGVGFYYLTVEPKYAQLQVLRTEIEGQERQIQKLTIQVKHLDELRAAYKQLEVELAKKQERLPPREEAVHLLKQVTDLGERIGLDIVLWKPGKESTDRSKLFVKMPVQVAVAGGYHTVALFFDRIGKLPRILKVSKLKMGSPKFDQGRAIIKTDFQLTAFAAP